MMGLLFALSLARADEPWRPLALPEPLEPLEPVEPVAPAEVAPADNPDQPPSAEPPRSPPPPRPAPLNPLADCRPAQIAANDDQAVLVTASGELRAWSLPELAPLPGYQLTHACTSLSAWRGGFTCTTAHDEALEWRDGTMSIALASLDAPPPFAAITPAGDLFVTQPEDFPAIVHDPDGPGPRARLVEPAHGPGRGVTSISFDPTGDLVAVINDDGTLWVGFWPAGMQYAGLNLLQDISKAGVTNRPVSVHFMGSDLLIVLFGDGALRLFALVDPAVPVPLLLDERSLDVASPQLNWVGPRGPLIVAQGRDHNALLLSGEGQRVWPTVGSPVVATLVANDTVYAARCDGSFGPVNRPASSSPGVTSRVHRLVEQGQLIAAADAWQSEAARLLGGPQWAEHLISLVQEALPIGVPPGGVKEEQVTPIHLIREAEAELNRIEEEGLWRARLASPEANIIKAEGMAPGHPEVVAARDHLGRVYFRLRALQLNIALVSAAVLIGALLIWHAIERRRRARAAVLDAGYNPFRRDSPNDPARTPFSEHPLVADVLRNIARNCVVVEAPPFSGKSALLRHVVWRLEREGLEGQPVRVAWVSLRDVPEDRLWSAIGAALARAAADYPGSEALLAETALDRFAIEVFLEDLWDWEGKIDVAPRRVVLVLDDIDVLGRYTHENQRLRGLLQILPGHRLTLMGAARSIRGGWDHGGADSPWFNVFQVRELAPMRPEDSARYVRKRLGPPFTVHPYVPAALHRRSQGRPLYLWHLAYATVEEALLSRTTRIRPQHVFAAEESIRQLILLESSHQFEGSEAFERALHTIAALRRRRDGLLARLATFGGRTREEG